MKNNVYGLILMMFIYGCAITSKEVESEYSQSEFPSESEAALIKDFEADLLDKESIDVFEKRAVEKVKEFFEYASIIQDTTINLDLRKKALEQCRHLFYEDIGTVGVNNKKYEIHEFLDNLLTNKIYLPSISDILISKRYHKSSKEDLYSGEVSLSYRQDDENGKVITILVKSNKVFGEEIREVWEVYLKEASL